jgi:ankyrin repeat protein
LRTNPKSATIYNNFGEFPLHIAVSQQNCNYLIIEKIANVFPVASNKRNQNGNLPIHVFCLRASKSGEHQIPVLKLLISLNPSSIYDTDNKFKQSPFELLQKK